MEIKLQRRSGPCAFCNREDDTLLRERIAEQEMYIDETHNGTFKVYDTEIKRLKTRIHTLEQDKHSLLWQAHEAREDAHKWMVKAVAREAEFKQIQAELADNYRAWEDHECL